MIKSSLSTSDISIQPGSTAQLTVTIHNGQDHADLIAIELEGIDVEWYAIPVASVHVQASVTQDVKVLFRVARTHESLASSYPFVVRVKSMESGISVVQQAMLNVEPFAALQVELDPKRAVSTFLRSANEVEVRVTNSGNYEETVDLYATVPEDACGFEFETERLTLKPGHAEIVRVQVEPFSRPLLGSTRLYGFTVTARSSKDSFVSGSAHGQVERHPLLSLIALALLSVALIGTILFAVFRPHPIVIHSFGVTPRQIVAGDSVTVNWDVANATDGVFIQPENVKHDGSGSLKIPLTETTTLTLIARQGTHEEKQTAVVVVTPAPMPAIPRIVNFTSSQKKVHEGESVSLAWKVEGIKTVMLNPLGIQKDSSLYTSQEVKPEITTIYELAAQGPGGTVSKTVTVEVVPVTQCIAGITGFKAKPDKTTSGKKVALVWDTENAVTVDIDNGAGAGLKAKGRMEVTPTATTIYTLRVTDTKGNSATKQITVTVEPPKVLDPGPDGQPPSTTNPSGTGTDPGKSGA
ncbi:MAG: hypothetical protein ABJA67_02530 [Chthonomonadales bacterium]